MGVEFTLLALSLARASQTIRTMTVALAGHTIKMSSANPAGTIGVLHTAPADGDHRITDLMESAAVGVVITSHTAGVGGTAILPLLAIFIAAAAGTTLRISFASGPPRTIPVLTTTHADALLTDASLTAPIVYAFHTAFLNGLAKKLFYAII